MAIPRDDGNLPARVKKLEQELARIKLLPSVTQSAVAPLAAATNSLWYDASAGNKPSVYDGETWNPVPAGTEAIQPAAVKTEQIDTGAVTSQNTQFRPGGGTLSNLIPDPEFIDPTWRDRRTAEDGWSTWTFAPLPQLAPTVLSGYTFGAKVTGSSVIPDNLFGPRGSQQINATIDTALAAGDLLVESTAMPVTASRVYQAHIEAGRDQATLTREVEWFTSGMVSISTSTLTGAGTHEPLTSPATAAFAVIRLKATGAVGTGAFSAVGVAFYLGGAGVEPGDWTASITFPASTPAGTVDEIILARNIPISRVQDYYGDITGIAVNAQAEILIREYDETGTAVESSTVGGPVVTAQATPAWVGDSGALSSVLKDTVRADVLLTAQTVTYGQDASVEFTYPLLALDGFVSRDELRSAVFSPKRLHMKGEGVQVYIDADDGLASIQAPEVLLGDGTNSVVITGKTMQANGETWHNVGASGEPAFQGNWTVDVNSVGFMKDAAGRVQLRGRAKEPVASSSVIFTLPVGYRPSQTMQWAVKCNNDASSIGWIQVTATGDVACVGNFAGLRVQTILSAVSFPTL